MNYIPKQTIFVQKPDSYSIKEAIYPFKEINVNHCFFEYNLIS